MSMNFSIQKSSPQGRGSSLYLVELESVKGRTSDNFSGSFDRYGCNSHELVGSLGT